MRFPPNGFDRYFDTCKLQPTYYTKTTLEEICSDFNCEIICFQNEKRKCHTNIKCLLLLTQVSVSCHSSNTKFVRNEGLISQGSYLT